MYYIVITTYFASTYKQEVKKNKTRSHPDFAQLEESAKGMKLPPWRDVLPSVRIHTADGVPSVGV